MNRKINKNNIAVFFFPHDDKLKIYDKKNENLVSRAISEFQSDPLTSSGRKILIYFGKCNNEDGFYTSKNIKADYDHFIDTYNFEIPSIPSFDSYEGIIYLSSSTRSSQDDILKCFTIAHELQHASQDISHFNLRLLSTVVFCYLLLLKQYNKSSYKINPLEIDASRKSKMIAQAIFGKSAVDLSISEQLEKASDNQDKIYWTLVQKMNLTTKFNLPQKYKNYYEQYDPGIQSKYSELKSEKVKRSLSKEEEEFLNAYDENKQYINEAGGRRPPVRDARRKR